MDVKPWQGRAAQQALAWVRAHGSRENLPCCICGRPIDYTARGTDMACSVQHVIPRSVRPDLTWDRTNWAPAHLRCNKQAGASWLPPQQATRTVVCLFGPPGAGKTTIANSQHDLEVYDADDPQWTDRRAFTAALKRIGADPSARAVVISSGATTSARNRTRSMAAATASYLATAPEAECRRRIVQRARGDEAETLAGVRRWFARHDNRDNTPPFPGWPTALADANKVDLGICS